MTSFHDLGHLTYFGLEAAPYLRAVGWLERSDGYSKGRPDPVFRTRLTELHRNIYQPVMCMGPHECSLCKRDPARGSKNFWIPGDGYLFVAPELILHYMQAHSYVPPTSFQKAVIACPDMTTSPYMEAFRENGGDRFEAAMKARGSTDFL